MKQIIKVNLNSNPYAIYLKPNIFKGILSHIESLKIGNFALIVTSRSVYSCYKEKIKNIFSVFPSKIAVVADGESAKTKISLFTIIQHLITIDKLGIRPFVICLGGGTVGDVGGFAASIYKRGIPYIQVPTTLLAQIDSSIGGKCAIDLKEAKNIIGSFYQPKAVFIDPMFLHSLGRKQIKEGLAEAVKYAIIRDESFFDFLHKESAGIYQLKPYVIWKIINTCASIKAKIVANDEKEKKGIRTILNFGHSFAHALETVSVYKKISHGEAVSIGMLYATYVSYKFDLCSMKEIYKIRNLLKELGLPTKIKYNTKTIYKTMVYDKKNLSKGFRMVLFEKIGKVRVVDNIPGDKILKTLNEFLVFMYS